MYHYSRACKFIHEYGLCFPLVHSIYELAEVQPNDVGLAMFSWDLSVPPNVLLPDGKIILISLTDFNKYFARIM